MTKFNVIIESNIPHRISRMCCLILQTPKPVRIKTVVMIGPLDRLDKTIVPHTANPNTASLRCLFQYGSNSGQQAAPTVPARIE
jgi:hypothetical protein